MPSGIKRGGKNYVNHSTADTDGRRTTGHIQRNPIGWQCHPIGWLVFRWPQKEKLNCLRSGKRGDQATSPPRPIPLPEICSMEIDTLQSKNVLVHHRA
ncbi:hypothetical protein TNCV_4083481 [Trichonephila clavipes]|nr:hypothetical protein TNCV_4083481 [Trichonephila clavipes]